MKNHQITSLKTLFLIIILFQINSLWSNNNLSNSFSDKLAFIKNDGQLIDMEGNLHPDVLYYIKTNSSEVHFKKNSVTFYMRGLLLIKSLLFK